MARIEKTGRLRRRSEFRRVFEHGRSYVGRAVVLYAAKVGEGMARVGFSVSRRMGSSVRRNRLKRRCREALRGIGVGLRPGYDLVVIARQPAGEMEFGGLQSELRWLLGKAGVAEEGERDEPGAGSSDQFL